MPNKAINCPNCKKETVWDKNSSFRPFCTERCKLIDLGDWASEKHAIAGEKVYLPDDEQTLEF